MVAALRALGATMTPLAETGSSVDWQVRPGRSAAARPSTRAWPAR